MQLDTQPTPILLCSSNSDVLQRGFSALCCRPIAHLGATQWSKLENVVIEGGGTLDANGDHWYQDKDTMNDQRPMMLDLLWIDGLTIRDMRIRRPGSVASLKL